jgi:hypothetical protein
VRSIKGRLVGKPKLANLSLVAPVLIYDPAGRLLEVVSAEAWCRRRDGLPGWAGGRAVFRVAGLHVPAGHLGAHPARHAATDAAGRAHAALTRLPTSPRLSLSA